MKVFTNAAWLALSRASTDVLSFVLFAVIARTFGPEGSGEYSYAFALATLLALFTTSGLEEYGIRQYARAAGEERSRMWSDLVWTQGAQLACGFAVFVLLAAAGVFRPSRWVVVAELACYLVGWMMARTLFIPAMAAQSMRVPALTDLACRLSAIVAALALGLLLEPPLPWLLVGFPLAGLLLLALAARNAARQGAAWRPVPNWQGIRATARQVAPFMGSDLLGQFYARADLLLIAWFLGDASVGLYATDIKFIEVGLLPLFLLGTAAYPLLSQYSLRDEAVFGQSARDLVRIIFLCAGWLSVGIYCLVPLLIVPLFGGKFIPAAKLLPWIALLAVVKGVETALYRVLYAARRQTTYLVGLSVGTVLIVILNVTLIPRFGLPGAILAATASTACVNAICAARLAQPLAASFLPLAVLRLLAALAATAGLLAGARWLGFGPWLTAATGCVGFPLLGVLCGLMPDPRRSRLFHQSEPVVS
ncbi:MAG TPA: oligosaccharide flippase family protein [Steroidobacteraceae bacterium]|nr:oligosaccharide flippase family protein [Steroidobacteraceae bacterium]